MTGAEKIKFIVQQQEITQKELAERINFTPETVSKYAKGKADISKAAAQAICEAFPCYRLEWLLGIDDIPTHQEHTEMCRCREAEQRRAEMERLKVYDSIFGGPEHPAPEDLQRYAEAYEWNSQHTSACLDSFDEVAELAKRVGFMLQRCEDGGAMLYKLSDPTGIVDSFLIYHTKISKLALTNLFTQLLGMVKVMLNGVDGLSEGRIMGRTDVDPEEGYKPIRTF